MVVISVQNSCLLLISWYNGHTTVHRQRTGAQNKYICISPQTALSMMIVTTATTTTTTTTIIIIIIIIIQFFVYLRADSNVLRILVSYTLIIIIPI
jgi:hypothetical protein